MTTDQQVTSTSNQAMDGNNQLVTGQEMDGKRLAGKWQGHVATDQLVTGYEMEKAGKDTDDVSNQTRDKVTTLVLVLVLFSMVSSMFVSFLSNLPT